MATVALAAPDYLTAQEAGLFQAGFTNIAGLTASVISRGEIVSFVVPDAGFFPGKKFCLVQDLSQMIVFDQETGRVWLSKKIPVPGKNPEEDIHLRKLFDAACIGPQVYVPYLKGQKVFKICKQVLESPFAFRFEFDPGDIAARTEDPSMRIVSKANMKSGEALSRLITLLRETYKEMLQALIDSSERLHGLPSKAFDEAFFYEPMRGDMSLANDPLAHYTWVLTVTLRDFTLPDMTREEFLSLITD